ncbi:MAG: hypothetical protein K0R92_2844 [Lachnospiraceae bacterium]|nr:hypothetical protein [Lachnospiraceae bacterium]
MNKSSGNVKIDDDRDGIDKGIRGLEIGVSILGLLGALATGSTDGASGSSSHQQASYSGDTRRLRNSSIEHQNLTVTVINYNLFNHIYIYNDKKVFDYLKEALECGKRVCSGETKAVSDYAMKCKEMYDEARYGIYPDDVKFMNCVINNKDYTYFSGSLNELNTLLTTTKYNCLEDMREGEIIRLEEEKRRKEEKKLREEAIKKQKEEENRRKLEAERIRKIEEDKRLLIEREDKLKNLSEKYNFNINLIDQEVELFLKEISDYDYQAIELTRVNILDELNYWKNQMIFRTDEKSKKDYIITLYQTLLETIKNYIKHKSEQDILAIYSQQDSEYSLFEQSLTGKTVEQLVDMENGLKTQFAAWENSKHYEPKTVSQSHITFYKKKSDLIQEYINKAREKEKVLQVRMYGKKGEENVEYAIKWLPKEYKSIEHDCKNDIGEDCILIRNKDFINEQQEIDHIVVGPQGVFIIETKYFTGKLIIDASGNWYRIKDGKNMVAERNPIQQVDRHHILLSSILGDAPIFDIICFSHPDLIIEGIENCDVDIVKSDLLGRYILKKESQKNYNSNEIEDIVSRINKYKCIEN